MAEQIRFEWNPEKAASNVQNHKVSFELAQLIFDDPLVYEFEEGTDHGEARYRAVGEVGGRLLFVAYTSYQEGDKEIVRIISARKATSRERRTYHRQA
jgi:uncharacterized DUF497 family protein